MNDWYFHTDIPPYVCEAIQEHMTSIQFDDLYLVTDVTIVPERDVGYSAQAGDWWRVEITREIPRSLQTDGKPGSYPTRVTIEFRIPVARPDQ